MGKINGWTIGSIVTSVVVGAFGIAKGIHDGHEADRKQTEKIEAAVNSYMTSHSLEPNSEV